MGWSVVEELLAVPVLAAVSGRSGVSGGVTGLLPQTTGVDRCTRLTLGIFSPESAINCNKIKKKHAK